MPCSVLPGGNSACLWPLQLHPARPGSPSHGVPRSGFSFARAASHPLSVQFNGMALCSSVPLAKLGVKLEQQCRRLQLGQMLLGPADQCKMVLQQLLQQTMA